MKRNEKYIKAINDIDDEYIEEASDKNVFKARNEFKYKRILLQAACIAVIASVLCTVLFFPFKNNFNSQLTEYEGNDYYSLIVKLDTLINTDEDAPGNLFQAIVKTAQKTISGLFGGNAKDSATESDGYNGNGSEVTTAPSGNSSPQTYIEVTDNQVSGVTEGDFVKRSDKYIFHVDTEKNILNVYTIHGEASVLTDSYSPKISDTYCSILEMYLSKDCNTVTLLIGYYDSFVNQSCTAVLTLDVSDPYEIRTKSETSVTGSYVTSRFVNNRILLFTTYHVGTYRIDYSKEESYIPSLHTENGYDLFSPDKIISPECISSPRYTVFSMFDSESLECIDYCGLLSFTSPYYVTEEKIYSSRLIDHRETDPLGNTVITEKTEICSVSYGEQGFEYLGSVTVDGSIDSQYNYDEHNGYLRVAASTRTEKENILDISFKKPEKNASLYCIDLNTWQVVSSVEKFAPDGDEITSVRFDGDACYICTAFIEEITDPVYFFDLSDVNNITYSQTGIIDGYSNTLVSMGDGYLVGIGYGETRNILKIEVYKEQDDKVVSVSKYEIGIRYYYSDYKSQLIDRENKLIGVAIRQKENFTESSYRYILLQLCDGELRVAANYPYEATGNPRALYIDGYLYLLGSGLEVYPVNLSEQDTQG